VCDEGVRANARHLQMDHCLNVPSVEDLCKTLLELGARESERNKKRPRTERKKKVEIVEGLERLVDGYCQAISVFRNSYYKPVG